MDIFSPRLKTIAKFKQALQMTGQLAIDKTAKNLTKRLNACESRRWTVRVLTVTVKLLILPFQ